MWWVENYIKITHLPTGISAKVEVPSTRRSMWAARELAMNLLASKVGSGMYGPQKLVRSYVIPDGQDTIPELESGLCVASDRA